MKRLFHYVPEIMLAAGVLLAAGILLACKCPRPSKYHGAAPIVGLGRLGQPEPECVNGKIPAGAKSCWDAKWGAEKCPDGSKWMWTMTDHATVEKACVPVPVSRPDAELYGKWMQVRPIVESCDGQNLMVRCW